MIIRIVKMTFKSEKTHDFLKLFSKMYPYISSVKGIKKLELLNDKKNKNVFFTYSIWENEEYLNEYRKSELFYKTWKKVKKMFSEKAEVWTVHKVNIV